MAVRPGCSPRQTERISAILRALDVTGADLEDVARAIAVASRRAKADPVRVEIRVIRYDIEFMNGRNPVRGTRDKWKACRLARSNLALVYGQNDVRHGPG